MVNKDVNSKKNHAFIVIFNIIRRKKNIASRSHRGRLDDNKNCFGLSISQGTYLFWTGSDITEYD